MAKSSSPLKAIATNQIAPGQVKVVRLKGKNIAIANVNGEFHAIEDLCSHDGGPLNQGQLEGEEIECPRHGARFNVITGAVVCFPAVTPIKSYPVTLKDATVYVSLEEI